MRRIFVLLFTMCFVTVAVSACSGSEETQLGAADNEEEFTYVDESDSPDLPREQPLEAEQHEINAQPEMVTATIPPPRQVDVSREKPQEKPAEKQKPDTASPQTTPQQVPVPEEEPQVTEPENTTVSGQGLMMWSVQIGAFKDDAGAMNFITDAKSKLNQPLYKDYDPVTGFFKVTVGSFTTQEQASTYKMDVRSAGFPDAFTVEVRR